MSAVAVEQTDAEFQAWLRAEIPLRCAEADADPKMMLTVEDMSQAIDDEMKLFVTSKDWHSRIDERPSLNHLCPFHV